LDRCQTTGNQLNGRVGVGGCVLGAIWLCAALVLGLLTALALYEQSAGKSFAGKSFAGADLRFVAGGWVLLLLPWLLRMGRH
jgi:hypothetical protein